MAGTSPRKRQKTLTVEEIAGDALTEVAAANWSGENVVEYSPELVSQIYATELKGDVGEPPIPQRLALLEVSQYLEKYLWPHFSSETASFEVLLSIITLTNQKLSERTNPWPFLQSEREKFETFFEKVLELDIVEASASERIQFVVFMTHCFQSLENSPIRNVVLRLVSLPLWHNLSPARLQVRHLVEGTLRDLVPQLELKAQPSLMKRWNRLLKKEAKSKTDVTSRHDVTFLMGLIQLFLAKLETFADMEDDADPLEVTFCERCLEFLTDLLTQLPTRRFVKILFQERGLLIKCKLSRLYAQPNAGLFGRLLQIFAFYLEFNIDEHSGEPFSEEDVLLRHYEKLTQLQRLLFHYWNPKLLDYAMMDCATLQKRETLSNLLMTLSSEELQRLVVTQLKLVSPEDRPWSENVEFLRESFLLRYEKRSLQGDEIRSMPLYPTEALLWDDHRIPDLQYGGETPLPIPKLNLQFLSLRDYLRRSFELYRLEAAHEIAEDLADVLSRMGGTLDAEGAVLFRGWARMVTPITSVKIVEVQRPHIGYEKPSSVKAEIVFSNKAMRSDVRAEWDELREHDVIFLISLRPREAPDGLSEDAASPKELYGVKHVRGCEVLEVKDEEGQLLNDRTGRVPWDAARAAAGHTRTLLVSLDSAQYLRDAAQGDDLYTSFNLLMRRRAKENNFKSVLECIRDLMDEPSTDLDWLQDVFLGYGHPAAGHYTQLPPEGHFKELDMKDTFLDLAHVQESFPDYAIEAKDGALPPFRLGFSVLPGVESDEQRILKVEPYVRSDPGPFPRDQPKQNTVWFTPIQVGAVVAGLQKGLSMVVGPPGTGKTDTAVQILHMLYHNFPNQRTLLVTHSNHALNDLFQKLMERDVPERYLLRLGIGEKELETESDFSRVGRVQAMLQRRLDLLQEVQLLTKQLSVTEDLAYSCETAGHFWMLHLLPRWEKFLAQAESTATAESVGELFPFKAYFASAPQPLFGGTSFGEDMERAAGCFRHLKRIFQELEECRAFELLKTQSDRVNYLLTKHAKIVALTCTHAALKRKDFLKIRFQYDNVLMEESGQVLEIETFLPWTLQPPTEGRGSLKRIVLIGDHHQLPPVVKHPALQRYAHMDQSLFQRFVRLGMPYLQLDAQGRCRPSIAALFNWRYDALGNLPCVQETPPYTLSNAGFAHVYQFVDVTDPDGIGESVPTPFFYQNLAEAEYVCRVFQYMRLLGYPAEKISILTTYNGQKHLLRDVFQQHCATHPAFGKPHKIATVDKFQGQQNDYILLSLVRTRAVGHIRDVRRLIVATSRAKLGLYIFGCAPLFQSCYEMHPVLQLCSQRPFDLSLVQGEAYGHCARKFDAPVTSTAIAGLREMDVLLKQMTAEWEAEMPEIPIETTS